MNDHLTDEDRLTEIGRLLALGALRMLRKKQTSPEFTWNPPEFRIKNTPCAKRKPMADCGR